MNTSMVLICIALNAICFYIGYRFGKQMERDRVIFRLVCVAEKINKDAALRTFQPEIVEGMETVNIAYIEAISNL